VIEEESPSVKLEALLPLPVRVSCCSSFLPCGKASLCEAMIEFATLLRLYSMRGAVPGVASLGKAPRDLYCSWACKPSVMIGTSHVFSPHERLGDKP